MEEVRKDIEWYEWLYQVSNLWKIKSLRFGKENILNIQCNEYCLITISKNTKRKIFKIHRLVAKMFIPNPENKPQVNHIDWNKLNNNINNLERNTQSENLLHAFRILWKRKKSSMKWRFWKNNPISKKIWQYNLQWELLNVWYGTREIKRSLWFRHSCISSCCKWVKYHKTAYGFIWKYIP